jgi:hypothetical protein
MLKFLYVLFLFTSSVFATSDTPISNTSNIEAYKNTYAKIDSPKDQFNVNEANKIFDQTNLKLSTQNLDLRDLIHAIHLFKKLNYDAQECIENTQKRLNNISTLIQNTPFIEGTKTPSPEITADQAYLRKEFKHLTNHQAQCRLFNIRSSEVITAYQAKVAEIKKQETFSQSAPVWVYFPKIIKLWKEHKMFKKPLDIQQFEFEWKKWLIHAVISLFLTSILLWTVSHKNNLKRIFRLKNEYLTWGLSLFLSIWLILNWSWCELHDIQQINDEHICKMFKILSIFSVSVFLNTVFFSIKRIRALFYWYELDFNYFYNLVNIIICMTSLLNFSSWLKFILLPSKSTLLVVQSLFLFLSIFFCIYLFFKFLNKHQHFALLKKHKKTLKGLNLTFFLSCLICNMIGYHILAMHLVYSSLIIILTVFSATLVIQALQKLYVSLFVTPLHEKIRFIFGYKENQIPTEFFMLKLAMQTIIFSYSIYFIGENMGFVSFYVTKFYQPLIDGITIGEFNFFPARIILGIIVFSLLFLVCRGISTLITRSYQFNEEEDTQVAIASILNYIGFAIALVAGLLIAGFNFTGLAIVAGALSVGIGLGLQSIVNNFVSGLILLIEKPLKPGDRINVDGVEGIVKKIRVRSTQILTPAREDIIVPNSDLVTRRVTNYMYTDKYLSIFCQIPVGYNSDVKLVSDLLLQAANNHDDVIKTGRNKPNVLLKSFGDYGLNFQLWCLIRDANKKSSVQSDLNYAILELFKTHNIEIPIPQQNLYLHDA